MNNWTNEINRIFNGRYNRLPEVFFGEVPPDIFSWLKNAAKKSKYIRQIISNWCRVTTRLIWLVKKLMH